MAGKTDPEGRKPDAEESAVQNPPDQGGHSEQPDTQDDDFDAGWGGEQPTSDDDPPKEPKDDDGEAATGDDDPGDGDEPEKEDEPSKEGAQDEPNEESPTRDEPESVDQVKQELKTWQGRLNKAKEEAERLEREVQERKEKGSPPSEPPAETVEQREARERLEVELTDDEKELLEGMRKEYPDIYRAMEIVAKKTSGETVQERLPKAVDQLRQEHIDPAVQRVQENQQATHYAEIQRAHPDVGDYVESGQLREWIESQPYKEAQQMLDIYERGSPAQAIQLLDQFKQAKGIAKPDTPPPSKEPDARRQQQLEASAAVRRRSGGPPKTSSKDDFEAGWDMGSG